MTSRTSLPNEAGDLGFFITLFDPDPEIQSHVHGEELFNRGSPSLSQSLTR